MARVQVSDETWSAFRAGLGSTPVSVELGRLVEREVGRRQRRSILDPDGVRAAVQEARSVAGELAELIARCEHAYGADEASDDLRPPSGLSLR